MRILFIFLLAVIVLLFGCVNYVPSSESERIFQYDNCCHTMCLTKCKGEFFEDVNRFAYNYYAKYCMCQCANLRYFAIPLINNLSCNSTDLISTDPFSYLLNSENDDFILSNFSATFNGVLFNKMDYDIVFLINSNDANWSLSYSPFPLRISAENKSELQIFLKPNSNQSSCEVYNIPIRIYSNEFNFSIEQVLKVYISDKSCARYN